MKAIIFHSDNAHSMFSLQCTADLGNMGSQVVPVFTSADAVHGHAGKQYGTLPHVSMTFIQSYLTRLIVSSQSGFGLVPDFPVPPSVGWVFD